MGERIRCQCMCNDAPFHILSSICRVRQALDAVAIGEGDGGGDKTLIFPTRSILAIDDREFLSVPEWHSW